MDRWVPFSRRFDESRRDEYHVLVEGVPDWLRDDLWAFVDAWIDSVRNTAAAIRGIGRAVRRDFRGDPRILKSEMATAPELALDAVDFVLSLDNLGKEARDRRHGLDAALYLAGSAYQVGANARGGYQLEHRVDPAVVAQVETIEDDDAGRLIRSAWSKLYGRNPDPSGAYRDALKAVEREASALIIPDDEPHLGKAIGELNARKEEFFVPLAAKHSSGVEVVIDMMGVIWHSHHDRHAKAAGVPETPVSREEAAAAVHLAITLVHWFQTGLIRPM